MARGDEEKSNNFIAFVSYSHRDQRWATWLHRAIETFRLPKGLISRGDSRRVGRLFLDRSELATSADLSGRIREALDSSSNLIVVCSPAARRSRWVNEEVRRFRAAGRGDRIFALIVDGDPAASGDDNCFPPALLEPDGPHGMPVEPLAADVRPGKDRRHDAKLKLIAGLLDLPFDALKRREQARRQRILVATTIASAILLVVMAALAIAALVSRQDAVRQRDTAQRTASFLRDLFDTARPEVTGGREITVRTMVDQAARDAVRSPDLRREPVVRASLLTTLADVYAKLQVPTAGRALIAEAHRYPLDDRPTALYRAAVEANLLLLSSDYAALKRVLDQGFVTMGSDRALQRDYAARLHLLRAQLAQQNGRTEDAERDFLAARRAYLANDPPLEAATTALLGAAIADVDNGAIDRGEARLRRVIAERRASGAPLDPDVLTAVNALGSVAIKRGDPATAEGWFSRALALQLRVYGPQSLDVALTRSNLGRALVEQRRFAAARDSLLAGKAVFLREVGDGADTLANLDDSLGLALTGLGDGDAADAAFARGLVVARANAMPKEIELLIDRAELACGRGRGAAGVAGVAAARAALARFALAEPWRAARIDNVAGACLIALGDRAQAAPLIRRSTPIVVARWGETSLFGTAARDRLRLVAGER